MMLVVIWQFALAQVVAVITEKDSSRYEDRVWGFTQSELKLYKKTVAMKGLISVGFTKYREGGMSLYNALQKNRVRVYFDYVEGSVKPISEPSLGATGAPGSPTQSGTGGSITTSEIVLHLEDFRAQRQKGTIVSLLGVATTAIGIATVDTKVKDPSLLVPYIGLGVMTLGAIITITADGHLRFRQN